MVGQDTSALLGATLVALGIAEQSALAPHHRRPVMLMIDEFHSLPGVDYDAILSELAKYGANLILATQSLARLESLDRDRDQALRATVFANLDGLFAFHTSAEDAGYLIPELGGEVDEQELVALGEHQCYVKLSAGRERLPTFWVQLDPPPKGDPRLGRQLAVTSATRFGRDRAAVERGLQTILDRVSATRKPWPLDLQQAEQPKDEKKQSDKGSGSSSGTRKRNEHRNQPPGAQAEQHPLFDEATGRAMGLDTLPVTESERLAPPGDERAS